ncbi:hypothetical protein [uncultured Aquimarina sp.]|uniref:hypothetical protein n=1 Tax=uncultured Aquimarina sp. TaxID=575652 RepID=UPI00261F3E93|nr:hypothetical protein [uncultured Aquimarina sp.]
MKNLVKLCLVVFSTTLFFSCEDDEKNQITDTVNAPWVYFDSIDSPVIDVTNIEGSSFEAKLVAPFDNVASYEIFVNYNLAEDADENRILFPLRTITDFPADLSITAADLAAALGVTVPDLGPGDQFDFFVEITGNDGTVFNGLDETQFLGDINNPGLQQALVYTTFISCPFTVEEAVGTYTITNDVWGYEASGSDGQFEVIAGPGPNEITMVNPFEHVNPATGEQDYNVVISVDPNSGIATIARQEAWHCDNFGCPYGQGFIETRGTGFLFACTGTLTITARASVGIGGWSPAAFVANKN